MTRPGYIMVDCKGANLLAQSTETKVGLYDDCKAAYESGKLIIAINLQYGSGVPMTPVPVFAIEEGGVYIFTASILQIRVASNDTITTVNLVAD